MRDYTTLDKIATIYNGNSINADYKKKHFFGLEAGFPFIATKDVSFNGEVNYDNGVRIPFNTEYKIAEAGSVFICAEGGSAGRKIAYITEKVCFGNKLFCIQPKDGKYLGRFLYYYLMSDTFQSQFKLMLTGLIGGVSAKKFKAFTVPVATFAEQERIVALLDDQFAKIDQLKANADLQLQAAKDLFQSALKQLLTPQKGWEEISIVDACESIFAGGDAPKGRIKESIDGKFCYPIFSNGVEKEGLYGYTDDFRVNKPAITIAARGTIGAAFIRTTPFTPIVRLITLIPNNNTHISFLYYLIKSLNIGHTGSSIPQLTVPMIKEMTFSFPSLPEQERIAARLDAISEKVKALQANYDQTITLCNDLKQSLLKSIFA